MSQKQNQVHYKIIGGKISAVTLKGMIQNGYKKKPQNHDNIDGYVLDKSLSGQRAQVYYHPETKHLVVNHRGTKGLNDVMTDIQLMFGMQNNKRFNHGKKITDEAIKRYDTDNISIVGHSLGSAVAKEANKKHNKETILVNPAVTHHNILDKKDDKETTIRSEYDPVSFMHNFKLNKNNTINVNPKSLNLLKEHNSDVLDRLGDIDVGML